MADGRPDRVIAERFELLGMLGRGGTATVHLAHDRQLDTRVALKIVHEHLAGVASMRARLRREVVAAGRLRHPHAIVAQELVEADGVLAVRMPYHPGAPLSEVVARDGPMTGEALRRVALQLAEALAAAHKVGLVHRDVTPNNVLIDDAGDAVLTDFGLARLAGQQTATGTGALGTPGFVAPETVRGQRADARSDLYGLGATLYVAATGVPPFGGRDGMQALANQLAGEYPRLVDVRPDLPRDLAATIDGLLASRPESRPAGADAVIRALRARVPVAERPTPSSRPHLPDGPYTVVVSEAGADRRRRRELRRDRRHRRPRSRFEQDIAEGVGKLRREVLEGWLGLTPKRSPEEQVATAVARAAGLPPDALAVAQAVYAPRFRLVEGTDGSTAERLADAVSAIGFDARVVDADVASARTTRHDPSFVGLIAACTLAILVAGVTMTGGHPWAEVGPFLAAVGTVVIVLTARGRNRRTVTPLPVAYGRDLRPWLSPEHARRLGPPPSPDAPTADAPVEVGVGRRAVGRIEALRAAVDARADSLPKPVLRDLRRTIGDLQARARALGEQLQDITAALDKTDDAAAARAVDQVQGRIDRLRTLVRAGEAHRAAELPDLEAALARHRDALEHADRLEARRIALAARLLDIAAVADRACADLLDTSEAIASSERLVDLLSEHIRLAREADDEVSSRPRRSPERAT